MRLKKLRTKVPELSYSLVLANLFRTEMPTAWFFTLDDACEPEFYDQLVGLMMEMVQIMCTEREARVLDALFQTMKAQWTQDFGHIQVVPKVPGENSLRSIMSQFHTWGFLEEGVINKNYHLQLEKHFLRIQTQLQNKLQYYENYMAHVTFVCPQHLHLINDDLSSEDSDTEQSARLKAPNMFQLKQFRCERKGCGRTLEPLYNGKPVAPEPMSHVMVFDTYPPVRYHILDVDETKDEEPISQVNEKAIRDAESKALPFDETIHRMILWYKSSLRIFDKICARLAPRIQYLKSFKPIKHVEITGFQMRQVQFRHFQQEAVEAFLSAKKGVVVLPCGAGKSHTGILAAFKLQGPILLVASSNESLRQWFHLIFQLTTLQPLFVHWVNSKSTIPQLERSTFVLTTYNMLTLSSESTSQLLREWMYRREWNLQILDEVHMCTATVFALSCEKITTKHRLGLTATLKDNEHVESVNRLVGPVVFEKSVRELWKDGFVARVKCVYVRCPVYHEEDITGVNRAHKLAYSPGLITCAKKLIQELPKEKILVVSEFVEPLRMLGQLLPDADVVDGATRNRQFCFERFMSGATNVLLLSRVGDMAVNLPECSVVISLNFKYGSLHQAIQRAGRAARKKAINRGAMYFLYADDPQTEKYAKVSEAYAAAKGFDTTWMNAKISEEMCKQVLGRLFNALCVKVLQ